MQRGHVVAARQLNARAVESFTDLEKRMNPKRIASLLREIGSLQAELADAFEQVEPKRKRVRSIVAPAVEPTKEALERAHRALRKVGAA